MAFIPDWIERRLERRGRAALRTAAAAWVAGVRWGMQELFSSGSDSGKEKAWTVAGSKRGAGGTAAVCCGFFGGAGNMGGGRREVELRWMVVGSLGKTRRRPRGLAAARWERMDGMARF